MDSRLLGIWESAPNDAAIRKYGTTRLHFFESGHLTYTVCSDSADQVMQLTYAADGDTITTQQPSALREERTKYWIDEDGQLDVPVSKLRKNSIPPIPVHR